MSYIQYSRLEDGKYCIKNYHDQYIVSADEIHILYHNRAIILKNNGLWTLYASSREGGNGDRSILYYGLYKFIDNILDYKSVEDGFAFKKADGWYFLFFSEALWYISDNKTREIRIDNPLKICDNPINVTVLRTCSKYGNGVSEYGGDGYLYGYTIETDNDNKYLVYGQNMSVFDHCNTELIKIYDYKLIKGSKNIAKIYLTTKKRTYVIGSLCDNYGHNFTEECTGFTDMGDGCIILRKGENTAVYKIDEDRFIQKYIPWGKHEIIKFPADSKGHLTFSVDGKKIKFDNLGNKIS